MEKVNNNCVTNKDEVISDEMGRGRPKTESTKLRSIRLPERIWKLIDKSSKKDYRSVNALFRKLVENHLINKGLLDENDVVPQSEIKNKEEKLNG